jgi:hypothetical protein
MLTKLILISKIFDLVIRVDFDIPYYPQMSD